MARQGHDHLTTSPAPDGGAIGELEDDSAYPYSTTSWYFLDAADAMAAPDTRVIVCLGDSITDGTASTLNGDDRWTDVLSRRLHTEDGQRVAVVNTGIGGNQVVGPADYTAAKPFAGGPSASARLERDVLGLSSVTDVVVFEGINDLGTANASPDSVAAGLKALTDRIRAKFKGVRVIGATLTSSRGSPLPGYGTVDTDSRRHTLNDLIRKPGLFDSVIDFDAATLDPQTGELRPEFVPPSTAGGPGDKLHPNRAGYLAMGGAVDLRSLVARPAATTASPAPAPPGCPRRRERRHGRGGAPMSFEAFVGRTETRNDVMAPGLVRGMAATLDMAEPQGALPPLWHWMLFPDWAPASVLGSDGHPRRGGFLPPVHDLPRRMWAGGRLRFHTPLHAGDSVTRHSTILSVSEKSGGSGKLVFVTVRHDVAGPNGPVLTEEQDIVYRGTDGEAVKPGDPAPPIAAVAARAVFPDPVLLFRYSALTGNGHRIHYDADYARNEEGYPGLVVHGPLQATWMAMLAAGLGPLARFSFRGRRPAFASAAMQIEAWQAETGLHLRTRDATGAICMTADAGA